ncbi:hypothetical protein M433DRAFT_132579 [Acidomyces richmondensis BFW]|nr:MAG: hypothetical protein FE78DRAFT_67524 [Acidomyces sp. 'richmondensis']KYG47895.1 hypothetical protein M433DRAFT_132579 [Acidomyces richmondensis BFW]
MAHLFNCFNLAARDGGGGNSSAGPILVVITAVAVGTIVMILLMTWAKRSHNDEKKRRRANKKQIGWIRSAHAVPLWHGRRSRLRRHGVPFSHNRSSLSHGSSSLFSSLERGEGPIGAAELTTGSKSSGMPATPPPSYQTRGFDDHNI